MDVNFAKFFAVVICFMLAVCNREYALNKRDNMLLVAGLACTLVADFFLVVLFIYPPGLVFFCTAQILYIVRFGGGRNAQKLPLVAVMPLVYFVIFGDILVALALVYAQLFLISYIWMIRAVRRKIYPAPNSWLIFAGMTLFMLCDINVAVWNLGRMGVVTHEGVISVANGAIWLFYAPSQVCLALSARKFGAKD
ncbi:MAG: lysoplasmalogenase [Defluviitaleaceae bacterium]|nr:lysoplasmalogenase [Defluviitaleaceae bacterium]